MDLLTVLKAQWDRTAAVVFCFLGLVVILIGWVGVSGVDLVVKQLPYIMSGGIAGILFVAIGATLWVSADMRDEWRELRRLRVAVDKLAALDSSDLPSQPALAGPAPRARRARASDETLKGAPTARARR
jgi:hypothetical protein